MSVSVCTLKLELESRFLCAGMSGRWPLSKAMSLLLRHIPPA